MARLLGALLLVVAAAVGVFGLGWIALDAVGTEWDYCPEGDCIAGWKIGAGFVAAAVAAGVAGVGLLRRGRPDSRSGEREA